MEIISYVSTTDGYTHYLINNTLGVPFMLWLFIVIGGGSFIFLVLKKCIG